MAEESHLNYVLILLFCLLSMVVFFIYLTVSIKYLVDNYSKKKNSIYWIQYIITCLSHVVFLFIYLCYLMKIKEERISIFDQNKSKIPLILITIFMVCISYIIIANLIFNCIASAILSFNIKKLINLNATDVQELTLKIKYIKTDIFNSKQHILYWAIFGVINIGLIVAFELEYVNYNDSETSTILQLKNFITYLLRYMHIFCFTALIIFFMILNYFRKKLFLKKDYYNKDSKFAVKLYNISLCQIIYNSDIILFKIIADLILNGPILYFLVFQICNAFFLILSIFILYAYTLILGALYLKIDKFNDIGKISSTVKYWFCLKDFNFNFGFNDHQNFLNENTLKYSKQEKLILKDLKLDKIEGLIDIDKNIDKINDENKNVSKAEDSKIEINEISMSSIDRFGSFRKTKSKLKSEILNFELNSELYILYKLLLLYFEKNEGIYLDVQNKITKDGSPFKRFFTQQNITKNKKVKARQTFGFNENNDLKNNFINNIDRISRISKLNSSSIIRFLKFKENKIFYSLEEKELREEFKKKYDLSEKETTFNIESLEHNAFFELFPFYQISVQDIKKALNPSDNKKIYDVLRNKSKNDNKDEDDSKKKKEVENNLFYTYNSLLMMEVYDHREFISSNNLTNFCLSYGNYLLENMKNFNFTFIPLILGVFNIEICGQSKVVILYRNPLYFSNFTHFNHWINFYITEGPEELKVSVLQKDVIDINQIEIKNSLKMNEADYDQIVSILKNDFNFVMNLNIQIYPIINLFIGDENGLGGGGGNNNDANESSLMDNISVNQNNLSGILNNLEEGNFLNNNPENKNLNLDDDDLYETENNSLVDKEYYSMMGNDIHTIKIYFTNFFRPDCELNKLDKNKNDLKSNAYCQYLEGQIQTYMTRTTMFELDGNENENN